MNILLINSCVRPESRTKRLSDRLIRRLVSSTGSDTEVTVNEIELQKESIQPLDFASLSDRDKLAAAGDFSSDMFRYARMVSEADILVFAAPFWDMSFPASLKVFIEAVMVKGLVFSYAPDGMPVSLCRASRMYYVSTAGGPVGPVHYGYDYIKMISEYFFGVKECCLIQAEMLDMDGMDPDRIVDDKLNEIDALPLM
ncbi:MAG: NAD(P)H-dependent oxidoreductase [Clostridiales bacterium]|nr:NAD(P)H-dependent oxidoreductase [Clostridiales bacterium]